MEFIEKNKYKDKFGIYGIRNKVNQKIYVGQTGENFLRRFWHHRWKLNNNSHDNQHLQKAWNKYGGDNFEYIVLEVLNNKENLDSKEIYYIEQFMKQSLSYNILYGGGGRRGCPMSENAKHIVGEKNRIHMTGKKHSEETRKKMSESNKSAISSKNRTTTILNDEIVKEIKSRLIRGSSMKEVSEELNVNYRLINNIVSNNTWASVEVKGWDDFIKNRKTTYRLTKDDANKIRELYNSGFTIKELCNLYQKERHTISNIIRYKTFK